MSSPEDPSPGVTALLEASPKSRRRRRKLRDKLRNARARVQADGEGFTAVVSALEKVGQELVGRPKSGLGDYTDLLIELVDRAGLETSDLRVQLFLLRQSRNDAVHEGAHARNIAAEAVLVALRVEDALLGEWGKVELRHLMVGPPVFVDEDDTIRDVRHLMLKNAFTGIPARVGESWYVLTDRWLAQRLVGMGTGGRKEFLNRRVGAVVEEPGLVPTEPLSAETALVDLLEQERPADWALVLVGTSDQDRLQGVISPSDLL